MKIYNKIFKKNVRGELTSVRYSMSIPYINTYTKSLQLFDSSDKRSVIGV